MQPRVVRVAAAVIRNQGLYLLAKRPSHKTQGGLWEFPGGKIEAQETPQVALERELVEELDAQEVKVGELVGAAEHDYGTSIVRIEAYWVTCNPASLRCLEHDEMHWFHPLALDQISLAPADRFLLELLR